MSGSSQRTPRIAHLARRLEDDIRAKKLEPGDPYLNTLNATRLLGVSTVVANRALQLLVKRGLLDRRQRRGTFVAQPNVNEKATGVSIERVHLLVHENYIKTEGMMADGVTLGIQEKLPQADIEMNLVPTSDEGTYTNRVVSEALRLPRPEGFVLVRMPLEVQRIIQASGLPAVIHGSPFPSITALPWIDRDHYQAGRLATIHLIRGGFRSITIITRDKPLPGDYNMFDGVRDEMCAAGLPVSAITWRPLPSDVDTVRCVVRELLHSAKIRRGFICRSGPLADPAYEEILSMGLQVGVDAGVIVLDVYPTHNRPAPRFPYLLLVMSPEEIGRRIGQLLLRQRQQLRPDPEHEVISLELKEPASMNHRRQSSRENRKKTP